MAEVAGSSGDGLIPWEQAVSSWLLSIFKDEDSVFYLGNLFCVHPHAKASCWGFFLLLERDLLRSSLHPFPPVLSLGRVWILLSSPTKSSYTLL